METPDLTGGVDNRLRFLEAVGDRFVGDDVFAAFHGGDCQDAVEMVRGHDLYGVDTLLFFEHLANVRVGGAAFVLTGGFLGGVVGFDDALADVATAGDGVARGAGAPLWRAQGAAKAVEESVAVPVAIVAGVLIGIADGGDADIGRAS